MKIDASELQALGRTIRLSGDRIGAETAKEMRASGRRMTAHARGRAPVGTGELRNSINDTVTGDGRFASMTVEVSADTRYSGYVEDGTSDTAPQPFLGPTFDAEVPILESKLATIAAKAVGG